MLQGSALSPLLFVIVMEALCREFRVALPLGLLYTDDLVMIAKTEDDLIRRLNDWKDNVKNRGMRVNMNKTKVMISGEWHNVTQKAVRWPCSICGRGIGNNSIQCTSCQKWVHMKCSGIKGEKMYGYEVEGARPRDRPKNLEIVEKDCQTCKLNRKDAMDRNRRRKQIRDD